MKTLLIITALVIYPLITQGRPKAYSGPAHNAEPEIIDAGTRVNHGVTMSTGYDSQYNFDGIRYGNNLAWGRLDYEIPLTQSLFLSMDLWYGNILGTKFDEFHHELDLSVALTHEFDIATALSLVFTHYSFFGALPSEPELGLEFAKRIGPIDLVLWYGYSFGQKGHYFLADLSHEFVLNDWLSIIPAAQFSYIKGFDLEKSGFNHAAFRMSFPISFNDRTTLTPFIEAVFPTGALKAEGLDRNEIHGGIVLQIKF